MRGQGRNGRNFAMAMLVVGSLANAAPEQSDTPLSWRLRDLQALMEGSWWKAHAPLLPQMEVQHAVKMFEQEVDPGSPPVDPLPENSAAVDEYFLPDYIRTSTGLIDPQKLLSETERNDVVEFIKFCKQRYKVNLFVSIFAAGQKVPPSVNAPSAARQVFQDKERNLLLHFHLGDIKDAQVVPDAELGERLGDEGRRDLLYHVKQDASVFSNPQDTLMAAMISLMQRTEADIAASAKKPETAKIETEAPAGIPDVNITIQEPEEVKKDPLQAMFKAWISFALENAAGVALHISALISAILLWLVWRNKRVVWLLASEPDKRLGAPHGAAQSRPVNYCLQERRQPANKGHKSFGFHRYNAL